MVTLTAPSGPHAGRPIWSCSTYPACRGMVAVDDVPRVEPPPFTDAWPWRIGQVWPLAIGLVLLAMLVLYVLAPAVSASR